LLNARDKFLNLEKIGQINCPIKIFHGKMDQVINYSHSIALNEKINNKTFSCTLIEGANHNNILSFIDQDDWQIILNYNVENDCANNNVK